MRKKTKIVKRAIAVAMVCSIVQGPTLSVLANTDSDTVAVYEDGFIYDENSIFEDIDVDLATDSDATPSDAFRMQSLYSRYADEEIGRLAEELQLVQYEDLYLKLLPYVREIDKLNIKTELKKALGREPRQDEIDTKIKALYMDKLDMRRSFVKVQERLETSLAALLDASPDLTTDMIRAKKIEVLLAFTYLDRQFGFTFGDKLAKDLILYPDDFFVSNVSAWDRLSRLFNLNYTDVELSNNITTYTKYIKPITGFNTIVDFLDAGIRRFETVDGNVWFQSQTKAIIEESQPGINVDTGVWHTLTTDATVSKYLIPLLNLSEENIYVISTMSTMTFGLTDTYLPDVSSDKTALRTELEKTAKKQESFLEFWYRISNERDKLLTNPTIVVVDSLQKYTSVNTDSQTLWSRESGENALSGVREFMTPMKLYNSYFRADGEARGKVVVMFLAKALTDRGQSVYTHELTHILDQEIWFDGYDRRSGQLAETFARGLFESYNNTLGTSLYAPMFNLNTTYELGAGRVQNTSPERFQTEEDLKTYMQGVLDVVYTLDYLEAEKILSMSAEDKKILLNKLELVADTRRPNQVKDSFRNLTLEEAAALRSIEDLVDNSIVSGRLQYKGNLTTGTADANGYYIVPLFVPIYAAVQNNAGSVGEISFRLYAHELLGEYGYKNGMMAYVSNKYANDGEALQQILAPEFNGDLKAFKKAMYQRRKDALENLDTNTAFTDLQDLREKMARAVETDLARMKQNQRNGQAIATGVKAVDELKLQVYQSYLQSTADFTTSIYGQEQSSNIIYLTRGNEDSVAGSGTKERPYESLSYALEKAKPGDTIKLAGNVTFRRDDLRVPYLIHKNITIDGQKEDGSGNYSLTLRGSNLELGANVELKNLTLNLITDSSVEPSIYLNGHTLIMDNINTKLSDYQDNVRPSVYAASSGGNTSTGTESRLIVGNGDSQTRFKKIDLNMDNAKLIIESEFVKVDGAVSIGGRGIEVVTKSQNIKTYQGNNASDNRLTFSTNRISNINITGIKNIVVENGAKVTLGSLNTNAIDRLRIGADSILTMPNTNTESRYQITNLDGGGTLEIYKNNRLDIAHLNHRLKVDLYGFENDLRASINQAFITVAGDDASKITAGFKVPGVPFRLVNESGRFILKDNRAATLADGYNPQARDISKYRGEIITVEDIRSAISGIPQDVSFLWTGALPDGSVVVDMTKDIEVVYADNSEDVVSVRFIIREVNKSPYIEAIERAVLAKRAEIAAADIRQQTKDNLLSGLDILQRRYRDEIQRAIYPTDLERIKTEGVSLIGALQIPDEPNTPETPSGGNQGGGEAPSVPEIPDNGNIVDNAGGGQSGSNTSSGGSGNSGSISSGGGTRGGGGGGSRGSGGGGGGSASGRITTGASIIKAGIYLVETRAGIHQSDVNTWQKDGKGIWHYYVNNALLRESWLYYKHAWYYLDKSGNMLAHTWIKENNAWLYVNTDGVRTRSQWFLVDSKWYYARENGYIFQDTKEVINGKEYRFDTSGAWLP